MPDDSVIVKEIKPALTGYLDEARNMLDPVRMPDEKVVHDVRVLMKKSRAAIKLLKTQIDKPHFNREYLTYREVGRLMRSWRETSVHRKLLKDLKKKYPRIFLHLKDNEKINRLMGREINKTGPSPAMKKNLENILHLLHNSLYRLRFMSLNDKDQVMIFNELERTYQYVSDCYLRARNYPKSVNLHEFRKKTKDFLYQLSFFSILNPKRVKSLEKRLELMGQSLGKYNDHAVLIKTLGYRFPSKEKNTSVDELILIVKQEQDKYLSKVWPSAYRIFRPGRKLTDLLGLKTTVS